MSVTTRSLAAADRKTEAEGQGVGDTIKEKTNKDKKEKFNGEGVPPIAEDPEREKFASRSEVEALSEQLKVLLGLVRTNVSSEEVHRQRPRDPDAHPMDPQGRPPWFDPEEEERARGNASWHAGRAAYGLRDTERGMGEVFRPHTSPAYDRLLPTRGIGYIT